MLAYSPVDAVAIPALRERLAHQPYRSCDYTAGVIYMWRDYFSTEYALCGDTLYIRMRYPDGQVYHLFPCGSEAPALSLSRIAPEADGSLRFATVPPEALDALRAMGVSLLPRIRYAVLPQLGPAFSSAVLYRFDVNIREASVLGLVGAGGIGAPLIFAMNQYAWNDVSAIFLGFVLLVWLIDVGSARLRARRTAAAALGK